MDQLRDPAAMRGWLATIGRRICRRMKHKEALAPILALADAEEPFVAPDFDAMIDEGRIRDCVRQAVDRLPEPYRQAYVLRDIEQLTAEEAAEQLGIGVRNLKTRLHRARNKVRHELDSGICGAR